MLDLFVREDIVVESRLQALLYEAKKNTVRHIAMARRHGVVSVWKHTTVFLCLSQHRIADFHPIRGLAELGRERAALVVVEIENQRTLSRERCPNRFRVDVRVAVHIAADPGREMQQAWHVESFAVFPENSHRGAFDVFVKWRHRAIQDIGDEKKYVFEFVGNRHSLGWMFVSLPARCRQQTNIFEGGAGFLRRHRGVQHVNEVSDDILLLAQYRAPCRLGRVRREHRFDA